MKQLLAQIWRVLRELAGDDAYERYCAHHRLHHAHEAPVDRRTYYLRYQQKKWGGINRCC